MLEENGIPAISGVDTRMLTRILRDAQGMRAIITGIDTPTEEAVKKIKATERPKNLVSKVSCKNAGSHALQTINMISWPSTAE